MTLREHLSNCEYDMIMETLAHVEDEGINYPAMEVARRLHISVAGLYRKMAKHNIRTLSKKCKTYTHPIR